MAILTPPASFCGPLNTMFMLAPLVTSSPVSSFNQRSTVNGPLSEFWRASVTIKGAKSGNFDVPGWRDTAGFLMSLRGGNNRARMFDARRSPMRGKGAAVGSTIAADASYAAGATTITVKGLLASQTLAMMVDDQFGIGENLYTVIVHSGSDVSGKATISFLPPLRAGLAENDSINLSKPTAAMRLVSGYQDLMVWHYDRSPPLTLEFFEDPEFDA